MEFWEQWREEVPAIHSWAWPVLDYQYQLTDKHRWVLVSFHISSLWRIPHRSSTKLAPICKLWVPKHNCNEKAIWSAPASKYIQSQLCVWKLLWDCHRDNLQRNLYCSQLDHRLRTLTSSDSLLKWTKQNRDCNSAGDVSVLWRHLDGKVDGASPKKSQMEHKIQDQIAGQSWLCFCLHHSYWNLLVLRTFHPMTSLDDQSYFATIHNK